MSQSNKSSGENKPQPAPQPKPVSPPPGERNLRTGYTYVADSADNLKKKGK